MSLPTGEEDTLDRDNPVSAEESDDSPITVSSEVEHRAQESVGEIVRVAREIEVMAATRQKLEAALGRSEVMADVLDGRILKRTPIIKHIPLVRSIGIPIEAIAGLIPVVGDIVAASASLYIVAEAHMAGVPWGEINKMLVKIAIDTGLGA